MEPSSSSDFSTFEVLKCESHRLRKLVTRKWALWIEAVRVEVLQVSTNSRRQHGYMDVTSGDESKELKGQRSDVLSTGPLKSFWVQVGLTVEWEPRSPLRICGSARDVWGDSGEERERALELHGCEPPRRRDMLLTVWGCSSSSAVSSSVWPGTVSAFGPKGWTPFGNCRTVASALFSLPAPISSAFVLPQLPGEKNFFLRVLWELSPAWLHWASCWGICAYLGNLLPKAWQTCLWRTAFVIHQ